MLTPLSTFGPGSDGSIQPPASYPPYPPVTVGNATSGYQRGYAYDPTTTNTVLVDPNVGTGGSDPNFSGGLYVIDGNLGTVLATLDTNGIYGGTYPGSAVGVADDGAVYMCNQINSSTNVPLAIYRWASVWQSNVPPSIAFSNTFGPVQRYGATMDVRGSGTNTQIILGSKTQGGSSGTNVTLFTTTDGTNFTPVSLATDVTTADFADGIAFGAGNTFLAKSVGGHALRVMSFNLTTASAVTLASLSTNSTMPGIQNLGPIALDLTNKLMAAIELVTASVGPQRVWLFDISPTLADPTKLPVLLDIKPFSPQNPTASAPNGFVHFGDGKLYAHGINNGLLTFTNGLVDTPAPNWWLQPVASQRLVAGLPVHFSALAYPAVTYQWRKNGTDIPGATAPMYTIAAIVTNDIGTYSVVVSNNSGSTLISSDSVLSVINPADLYHLNTLWSVAPQATPYMNTNGGSNTPNQRSIAYNSLSNELYIVSKGGSVFSIYALNATNVSATPPAVIKTLNTTGIPSAPSGGITLVAIAVAEDGAIYACNMSSSSGTAPASWKLYRWANSDPSTVPQLVFQGEPASQTTRFRWGDVMAARGSGPATQVVIDNQDGSARYLTILVPIDSSMTAFTNYWFYEDLAGTTIGRSIDFGAGDTVWQKRENAALVQVGYDTNQPVGANIVTTLGSFGGFPSALGGVSLSLDRDLCAGINFGSSPAHTLDLYDVSDLTSPLRIAQYAFPFAKWPNANFIGQTIIAGDYLFTLSANNGVMAFQIVSGPPTAPGFAQQPQSLRLIQGGSGSLSVVPDQPVASYQWQQAASLTSFTNLPGAASASYSIASAQLTDAGSYRCIVSNYYGMGTSTVATVSVTLAADTFSLSPLWNAAPFAQPYVTTNGPNSPNERSIAYNALSNQLIVVQCPINSTDFSVYVVDATTGTLLYTLNTNGVVHVGASEVSGQNPADLLSVAVADDGAVYICNESPNSSGGSGFDPAKMFRLYRWADSGPSTAPVNVFVGDPAGITSNYRWGDGMTVRGTGTDTQVLLDSNDGNYAAILMPTDGTMTAFTNFWSSSVAASGYPRSIQFAAANTAYFKRYATAMRLINLDTNTHAGTLLATYSGFPSTMAGVTQNPPLGLAAGVDHNGSTNSPDTLVLFEVSDLTTPMLIARYNFPINQQPNVNHIDQTVFAGNKIWALDGNNGLLAFNIISPAKPQLGIARSGNQMVLFWPNTLTGYTLYSDTVVNGSYSSSEGAGSDVAGYFWVTNSLSGTEKFYRLAR